MDSSETRIYIAKNELANHGWCGARCDRNPYGF